MPQPLIPQIRGSLNKQQASIAFANGRRIRVTSSDLRRWKIVDRTMADSLHDAILANNFVAFGTLNSHRNKYKYDDEGPIVEKPNKTKTKTLRDEGKGE